MTETNRQPTRLIVLLSLLSLVGYALRSNITIAQEMMAPELGLTMADMGTISAWGFQLAYALCQVPAGFLPTGSVLGSCSGLPSSAGRSPRLPPA